MIRPFAVAVPCLARSPADQATTASSAMTRFASRRTSTAAR